MTRKRFQEGGKTTPKKSQIYENGAENPRDYDPFADVRKKYATPGTVIKSTDLPNQNPRMREVSDEEMKDMKKKFAKGGFVPFGKKAGAPENDDEAADKALIRKEISKAKGKKGFAAGGTVTEEMDDEARGDGGKANWASDYEAGDRADRVGDRPAGNMTAGRNGQSFRAAFAAARKAQGSGGTFTWNGKQYTTARASDKSKAPVGATGRQRASEEYSKGGRVGYAKGGRVGYSEGGPVARGMGAALRGGRYTSS